MGRARAGPRIAGERGSTVLDAPGADLGIFTDRVRTCAEIVLGGRATYSSTTCAEPPASFFCPERMNTAMPAATSDMIATT
jgi:hypothetical protein